MTFDYDKAEQVVWTTCDRCYAQVSAGHPDMMQSRMDDAGWTIDGYDDLCPGCTAEAMA